MTNLLSERMTNKEEKRQHRLDCISKLAYYGGKRRKERRLGTITQHCIRDSKGKTLFDLVEPIRARIAEDGVGIRFQDDIYPRATSFRQNVQEKLSTKLSPTVAEKSHRTLYTFFEKNNIDRKTTHLLIQQRKIYINGKKVRWRLGFRLGVEKGDIVRV